MIEQTTGTSAMRNEAVYTHTASSVSTTVVTAKIATASAPCEMSLTTLAKPMIATWMWPGWMPAAASPPSMRARTFSSASPILIRSTGLPVAGSCSCSCAETIAPEKSFATRRPTMPALRMLSLSCARPSGVGSKPERITSPAWMPPSTTSV